MAANELVPFSEYQQYPLLTQAEFDLACHHFHNRYIQATLGPLRRTFRVDVRHDMFNDSTYLEIIQPITAPHDDVSEILNFGALRASDNNNDDSGLGDDMEMMGMDADAEEADTEAYQHASPDLYDGPHVVFEVHLAPFYQVPVLWFTMKNLPGGESSMDMDSVYRYLVPEFLKAELRNVGVMGGVSADNHPLTGVPSFFMHPCSTQEAMDPFQAQLRDYLFIWLGIVGSYVGLQLPLAMAVQAS